MTAPLNVFSAYIQYSNVDYMLHVKTHTND